MRFVKQRNQYSCGPVVILNALKWAEQKVSYKSHFKKLKKLTKCNLDGSVFSKVKGAIYSYSNIFKIGTDRITSIKRLEIYIKNGAGIILQYYYRDSKKVNEIFGHFTLILPYKINGKFALVNNYVDGPALQFRGRKELKRMMSNKSSDDIESGRAIILYKKK